MWSKASPLEEGLAVANHIVPVVCRYPVVKVLFTGEIEEGAPTNEHIFLYENMAPQGDQKNETKTVVESEKESEKESISDVSISNKASGESGKDTRKNKSRKRTHRGTATKNVLPRQRNFVPTPGYSVLSNSEKARRNKELAQRNHEALQAMREKCKVVITPIDQTPNGIVLLTKTPEKEHVWESYGDIANENEDEHLGPEDQLLTVKEYVASQMETGSTVDDMEATNAKSRKVNQDAQQQNAETSSQNMSLTGGEESRQVDHDPDQQNAETSSQNKLLTGEQSRQVNHDPEQQNAETSSQNMSLTGEEESHQVNHDPEQQNAETSSQNMS